MYLDHTFGKRSELWSLKPPKEELDPGGNTLEIFFLFTTESWTTTTTAFAQALRNSDCIANVCVKCSGYSMHEFFSGQLLERQQVDIFFSFSQHLHQKYQALFFDGMLRAWGGEGVSTIPVDMVHITMAYAHHTSHTHNINTSKHTTRYTTINVVYCC